MDKNSHGGTSLLFLCKHLLALRLVSALDISTAKLELKGDDNKDNDQDFANLLLSRIGL